MKQLKYLRKQHLIKTLNDTGELIATESHESTNKAKKASRKLQGTLGDGTLRLDISV